MVRTNPARLSSGDGYRGLFVEGIEEWSQFFTPCNWRTFHPVMLEAEDDTSMGGFEITTIILGLGFRIRWNYAETEQVQEINERVAEFLKGNDHD